jgi:hypothetical protein
MGTRRATWALLWICSVGWPCVGCAVGGMDDEGWQTEIRPGTLQLDEATPERVRGTYAREGVTIAFEATRLLDGTRSLLVQTGGGRILIRTQGGESTGADTLADLFDAPEAVALPWLSRELGRRGISGRAFPASFELHSLALVVGKAKETSLPPLEETVSGTPTPRVKSGRCAVEAEGDACFGMCGNGCNCWRWVCGDCCWHGGCAAHDDDCRSCSFANPLACARCATFVDFFRGGGCDDGG